MKKGCVNIFPAMWKPLFHTCKICDWFLLSPPISCSPFLSLRNFFKALSFCYVYSLERKTGFGLIKKTGVDFFQCLSIVIRIIYIPQRKLEEKDSIIASPISLSSRTVHQKFFKKCIFIYSLYSVFNMPINLLAYLCSVHL